LPVSAIAQLVQDLPAATDPDLLVGADQFSDAAVYRLGPELAVVQSVDFFPPIVNDPFVYGQIAAANALSDGYAMGGQPRTALNIVGFPDDKLGLDVLRSILRGGAERVKSAGAVVVGGHSVRDAEVKYGLSVTGVVDPAVMMTNRAAAPSDTLVLTKPLGTGFVTTAARADRCPDNVLAAACASMIALNRAASEAAMEVGVRAATDITGFGLAGHALEAAEASGVTLRFELDSLPLLPGAMDLARAGNRTRANPTNRAHVEPELRLDSVASDDERLEFLFDPQTSGGLLIAVAPDRVDALLDRCRSGGVESATTVGMVTDRGDAALIVS
jgi:selenide,water dikinase